MKSWLKFGIISAIIGFSISAIPIYYLYTPPLESLDSSIFELIIQIILYFVVGGIIGFIVDFNKLKNYLKGGIIGGVIFLFIFLNKYDLFYSLGFDVEFLDNLIDSISGNKFDIIGAGGLLILFIIAGAVIGLTFKEVKKK